MAIPPIYRLIFTTLEPITALSGAYFAYFEPQRYQALTLDFPSTPTNFNGVSKIPLLDQVHEIVLAQLANLYLLFAVNEALVLRSTSDVKVWRTLLLGLLIADFGHLWTMRDFASAGMFWRFWEWNAMAWGNIGIVYIGMATRICFLAGVGIGMPVKIGSHRDKKKA